MGNGHATDHIAVADGLLRRDAAVLRKAGGAAKSIESIAGPCQLLPAGFALPICPTTRHRPPSAWPMTLRSFSMSDFCNNEIATAACALDTTLVIPAKLAPGAA